MLALPRIKGVEERRIKFKVEDEDLRELENYFVKLLGLGC